MTRAPEPESTPAAEPTRSPAPLELDRPDVVAEVRAAFVVYEAALVTHDLTVLDTAFWDDPRVIRFGIADAQRGPDAIAAWRRASGPVPRDRALRDPQITTLGPDVAIAWTHFTDEMGSVGRQSQVWARIDGGWRIVAAHVSRVDEETASG